jgi:iron-sulfur cluster repair protein YtfE (RIC family)
MIAYVRDFWHADLQRHFREEEELIFPLLPASDELVQRALREHRQLEEDISCLGADDAAGVRLAAIAALLEAHIRFEERALFPHIEQAAAPDDLQRAGIALQDAPASQPVNWADEFWKE